jgi:hypothetical protein
MRKNPNPVQAEPTGLPEPGSISWAEQLLRKNKRLSGDELALLIEKNPNPLLPRTLRDYEISFLRRTRKRGVKPGDAAVMDFAVADADDLYHKYLLEFRQEQRQQRTRAKAAGDILPDGESSPQQLALERVLEERKADFLGVGSWRGLRNLISAYKKVKLDPDDELYEPTAVDDDDLKQARAGELWNGMIQMIQMVRLSRDRLRMP